MHRYCLDLLLDLFFFFFTLLLLSCIEAVNPPLPVVILAVKLAHYDRALVLSFPFSDVSPFREALAARMGEPKSIWSLYMKSSYVWVKEASYCYFSGKKSYFVCFLDEPDFVLFDVFDRPNFAVLTPDLSVNRRGDFSLLSWVEFLNDARFLLRSSLEDGTFIFLMIATFY